MEWIKKHWKEVLIGLLIIFSLNKCTVACNRGNTVNELNLTNSVLVQKVDSLTKVNDILSVRLDDGQKSQNAYQNIATGNQKALIDSIAKLRSELNSTQRKLNSIQNENIKLRQENNNLRKSK